MRHGNGEAAAPQPPEGLVVGVFFLAVVSHVTHALQLRDTLEQGALDAFFQRYVSLAAPLATTAKLQHSNAVVHYIYQADLAAMAGQTRVDLGLQE